jgi:hypothetical protein
LVAPDEQKASKYSGTENNRIYHSGFRTCSAPRAAGCGREIRFAHPQVDSDPPMPALHFVRPDRMPRAAVDCLDSDELPGKLPASAGPSLV